MNKYLFTAFWSCDMYKPVHIMFDAPSKLDALKFVWKWWYYHWDDPIEQYLDFFRKASEERELCKAEVADYKKLTEASQDYDKLLEYLTTGFDVTDPCYPIIITFTENGEELYVDPDVKDIEEFLDDMDDEECTLRRILEGKIPRKEVEFC